MNHINVSYTFNLNILCPKQIKTHQVNFNNSISGLQGQGHTKHKTTNITSTTDCAQKH